MLGLPLSYSETFLSHSEHRMITLINWSNAVYSGTRVGVSSATVDIFEEKYLEPSSRAS